MKRKKLKTTLPFDIPSGFARGYYMEIYSGKEAVLTGDFEVTEIEDTVLKIKSNEHRISFIGNKLEIINYSADGIRIGGEINSIDFEQ